MPMKEKGLETSCISSLIVEPINFCIYDDVPFFNPALCIHTFSLCLSIFFFHLKRKIER